MLDINTLYIDISVISKHQSGFCIDQVTSVTNDCFELCSKCCLCIISVHHNFTEISHLHIHEESRIIWFQKLSESAIKALFVSVSVFMCAAHVLQ